MEFNKNQKITHISDLVEEGSMQSEIEEKPSQRKAFGKKEIYSNPDRPMENEKIQQELENQLNKDKIEIDVPELAKNKKRSMSKSRLEPVVENVDSTDIIGMAPNYQ